MGGYAPEFKSGVKWKRKILKGSVPAYYLSKLGAYAPE